MMKASIIIRAYNAEKTIIRAIKSAINQNFPKEQFEIIIINDGSTDATRDLIESFKDDSRIVIIDQKQQGPAQAANIGFKKSRGEYVVLLDSDDELRPNFLKELSWILNTDSNIDFVYSDYYEEHRDKKRCMSPQNIFQTLAGGTLFRKDKFALEGFYRKDVFFPEYDLMLRTLKRWRSFHCQKPLFIYHRRQESLTGHGDWLKIAFRQLKALHPDKNDEISKIRTYRLA